MSHWGNSKARIVVSFEHHKVWGKILAFMATEVNNTDGLRLSYLQEYRLPGYLQDYRLTFTFKINLVQCMHG